MTKFIFSLLILLSTPCTSAAIEQKKEPILDNEKILTFGVVPQQSASKLAKLWTPIINELTQASGIRITFSTAPDIPTFEKRLSEGQYDIAYMNPYHYIVFHQSAGYQALAKARDKRIKGIIVVAKEGTIKQFSDLNNMTLAFPAPAAFAASILTQSDLMTNQVNFTPKYVSSHDSVYLTVAKGLYPAGGGILRTFNNISPDIRAQLRVFSTTAGFTPHAIAIHPRVTARQAELIQDALNALDKSDSGKKLLNSIKIKGFESANNEDWDDVRALQLSVKVVK